jgi:hypothetical protein
MPRASRPRRAHNLKPGSALTLDDRINHRELVEELGVIEVELGPEVATHSKKHLIYGQTTRQAERYFIVRIPAGHADPARQPRPTTSSPGNGETLVDLRATGQVVCPLGLTDWIDNFLASGAPASPFPFSGWEWIFKA